jgi:hypothetical protein
MKALLPTLGKMTSLTSLGLSECQLSPEHFKFIFTECSALSKLQSLDLREQMSLKSTTLTNLTSLSLQHCYSLGTYYPTQGPAPNGLVALLSSPVVQYLTHLNLSYTPTDGLSHITIATSPFLSNLVSLELTGCNFSPDAVAPEVASTTLTKLTRLNLSSNPLGDRLIAQLFSSPPLFATNLQSINLGSTKMTGTSLAVVLKACPHLRELIIAGNIEMGAAEVALIAASMSNLTKLDLFGWDIANEGYVALATAPTLSTLRELNLEGNWAEPQFIIALINSPVLANLTHLNLALTHNGPEVLIAIAQSSSMSNLQHLAIDSNGIGDKGVIALAQSTTLTNLTSLAMDSYLLLSESS